MHRCMCSNAGTRSESLKGFLMYFMWALVNFVCICYCRYTAVAMPMLYNTRYSSRRRVAVMIAVVWFLSFAISCPLLFGLNNTGNSYIWSPVSSFSPLSSLGVERSTQVIFQFEKERLYFAELHVNVYLCRFDFKTSSWKCYIQWDSKQMPSVCSVIKP